MVPYLWRRHLAIFRVILAAFCLLLYIVHRVENGIYIAVVVGAFGLFSLFHLVRGSAENTFPHTSVIMLDLFFFFLCALHPTREGLWLSTLAYFFLLIESALLYEWLKVVGVVAGALAFLLTVRSMPVQDLWGTVLLSGVLATLFALQKKSLQEKLWTALRRSVIARSEAETAREFERQRIAADFHDGPLQSFISFQMRLEIVRKLMSRDQEAAQRELGQLQELGKTQVAELRSFVRNMQPIEVDNAGMAASIHDIVQNFSRDTGIETSLNLDDLPPLEETDTVMEVLQILRESLNNVRKHSKAARVSISIGSVSDGIEIVVEDDGSGFPFSGSFTLEELELLRLGPKSIKRRIRTLGGDLTLESRPSKGAELKIRIPA